MKRIFGFAIVLAVLMSVTGCSLFMPRFDCKFENDTGYTVFVTNIDGGSPSSVTLGPYDDETVSIRSDKISFTYSPSNLVYSRIYSALNEVDFYSK